MLTKIAMKKAKIIKLEVENSNDLEKLLGSSDYEKISNDKLSIYS